MPHGLSVISVIWLSPSSIATRQNSSMLGYALAALSVLWDIKYSLPTGEG